MDHKYNRQLIVFTRFPVAGVTKTRLIPSLGAAGAAALQRRMTELILQRITGTGLDPEPILEIRFAGGDETQMRAWLGDTYLYNPQTGDDLGSRKASAFEGAFQRQMDQVVLVGTGGVRITGVGLVVDREVGRGPLTTDGHLTPAALEAGVGETGLLVVFG